MSAYQLPDLARQLIGAAHTGDYGAVRTLAAELQAEQDPAALTAHLAEAAAAAVAVVAAAEGKTFEQALRDLPIQDHGV